MICCAKKCFIWKKINFVNIEHGKLKKKAPLTPAPLPSQPPSPHWVQGWSPAAGTKMYITKRTSFFSRIDWKYFNCKQTRSSSRVVGGGLGRHTLWQRSKQRWNCCNIATNQLIRCEDSPNLKNTPFSSDKHALWAKILKTAHWLQTLETSVPILLLPTVPRRPFSLVS